jgi:methyl-accepting chemotaxis protein
MDGNEKRNYTKIAMEDPKEINSSEKEPHLEQLAFVTTQYIGSFYSLVLHTVFFVGIFSLQWFGFKFEEIMLILTTAVSLEAIYLAIFIQMTVNRQAHKLAEVSEDVDDIQEDVEEISKDIDDIQEDVEDISEDVEKGDENLSLKHERNQEKVAHIESILKELLQEVRDLKDKRQ